MASELRVNTLKDASGNNSIATSFVAEGSGKSWITSVDNGTSISDSFNVSSTADTATGRQKVAITSAFASTTTISCTSSGQNTSTNNGSSNINRHAQAVRGDSASEIFLQSLSMSALIDLNISQYHAYGDLA
jgi:hypothetical protein|tara:strand:+ start:52 stop:447 length:396 start_codon:yes stop_codon:yes gene_type:complete